MTGFIQIIDKTEYEKAKSYFNGKNIQPDEYKDIYKDIFCKVVAEIAVSYRNHNTSTLRYDLLKYDFFSKGINGRDLKNMVNAHQLAVCRLGLDLTPKRGARIGEMVKVA